AEAIAPHRVVTRATTSRTRPHAGARAKAVAQMRTTAYSATLVCSAENRAMTPEEVAGYERGSQPWAGTAPALMHSASGPLPSAAATRPSSVAAPARTARSTLPAVA